ncbi:NlpC/P60 family protein [Solobacterium sp.]|uniref:C40 family peptidase n=1 Tax=Solobacterium sp. TaxID=2060878 RepID=UPI001CAD0D36|nr:NlpC/P60 family protein [Solobacterium sp.]MBF1085365.1 C40 family peptidase [Solobacterium sp.]
MMKNTIKKQMGMIVTGALSAVLVAGSVSITHVKAEEAANPFTSNALPVITVDAQEEDPYTAIKNEVIKQRALLGGYDLNYISLDKSVADITGFDRNATGIQTVTVKVNLASTGDKEVEKRLGYSFVQKVVVKLKQDSAPVVQLKSDAVTVNNGDTFNASSYISYINDDSGILPVLSVSGEVDMDKDGEYPVTYTVSDTAGHTSSAVLTVTVKTPVEVAVAKQAEAETKAAEVTAQLEAVKALTDSSTSTTTDAATTATTNSLETQLAELQKEIDSIKEIGNNANAAVGNNETIDVPATPAATETPATVETPAVETPAATTVTETPVATPEPTPAAPAVVETPVATPTPVPTPTKTMYPNVRLNVRTAPSTSGSIITTLNVNDPVYCTDTVSNGWQEIVINGQVGWVYAQYIQSEQYVAPTPQYGQYGAYTDAINLALSFVGNTPYVWGGASPSGFDCSGLVKYCYGISQRTTYTQQTLGTHRYDVWNAPAGALYFWGSESAPYHVAIALGGGQTVQAMNENDGIQVIGITYFMPSYYVIIGQ